MRRMLVMALTIVVGLTGLSLTSAALAARNGDNLQAQAAKVRAATAKYHNEDAAIAAGYLRTDHCIEDMGYHYVNPALIFDGGILDQKQPEILLYAPTPNGRRLVGVEYLVPVADTGGTHPDLFGKPFDGPMPEHEPNTTGDHYDLHAWIWSRNAAGMLATWNTAVDC